MERPISYTYPAFFYYDGDGIAIEFPDLPGALSCARNTDEGMQNARECLGLHLFGMERDGDEIPKPSDIDALKPDDDGVIIFVEVFMPSVRDREKIRCLKEPFQQVV